MARVEMAFMMFEIFVRQQDLGDLQVVSGEELLVGGHEARLADGGAGLELFESAGAFIKTEHAHAGTDCTGRDDDDLMAGFAQCRDLGDELADLREVGLLPAVREDTGAQLDDDTADIFQRLGTHGGVGSKSRCEGRGGMSGGEGPKAQ